MRLLLLAMAAAGLASARVEDGTISVTAAQSTALPRPDEFHLDLYVVAPVDRGLNDLLAAFAGLALRAEELTTASARDSDGTLGWYFTARRPLARMPAALLSLRTIGRDAASGLWISYSVRGSISQAVSARQVCALPTLLTAARAKADVAAAAAGMRVGELLQATDGTAPAGMPTGVAWSGAYGGFSPGSPPFLVPETITQSASCFAVAQFRRAL